MKTRTFFLWGLAALMMFAAFPSFAQDGELSAQEALSSTHWRIGIKGGFGYRLAKLEKTGNELVDDHNKALMSGVVYGADITYFFGELGVGVKYSDMHSSKKDAVAGEIDGEYVEGMYTDVVDMRYIGPMVYSRMVNRSGKGVLYVGAGIGYLDYTDNGRLIQAATLRTGVPGVCLELGYDFRIVNNVFLGASVGIVSGVANSYTVTMEHAAPRKVELDKDQRESLMHGNASLGLSIYF